jgi:hypothetical protein
MRQISWLALLGVALCLVTVTGGFASEKVAALDGTIWKVDVDPDSSTEAKGEKDYKETLTFADGYVTMSEGQKVGFASSPYEVSKSGEHDWTFKAEQVSDTTGKTIWAGTIHEKEIKGKLIRTSKEGAVLTYTFKGRKLD